MMAIDFRPRLFVDEADRDRSERAMHFLLHALCCINAEYLKRYGASKLYASGVRYDNARAGKKEWQDIPTTLLRRKGDCKDLACWLVAEDWMRGVRSRPYIRYRTRKYRKDDGTEATFSLYHVLVQRPGGVLEDPSERLGMGRDEWLPMLGAESDHAMAVAIDAPSGPPTALDVVATRNEIALALRGRPEVVRHGLSRRRGVYAVCLRRGSARVNGLPVTVDGYPVVQVQLAA